jgi:hypothetical protein
VLFPSYRANPGGACRQVPPKSGRTALTFTGMATPHGSRRSGHNFRNSGAVSVVSEQGSRQNTSPTAYRKERIGPLEGARAPICIWLRTAPDEVTEGLGMFALLNKELKYYQAHPDSPHVDYYDHDAMLDDGWVLD